jgi:two-component system sensor histidine kinase ChvG
VLLSLLLSSTIANPLRRLSAAAIRVRRGAKEREEIPDFSARQDEIGNLSIALREMTTRSTTASTRSRVLRPMSATS